MPESMNINQNYNLYVNLTSQQKKQKFVVGIPRELVAEVNEVTVYAFDDVDGTLTKQSSQFDLESSDDEKQIVTIKASSASKLSMYRCVINFKAPAYQIFAERAQVSFMYEIPTSSYLKVFNVAVYGNQIENNLEVSSTKINQ